MAELLTGTYEDIPRYYTAIAEWISCMLFCYFYRRKIKKSCFAGIAAGMLVLQTGWLMLTGNVSTLFWIPCMIIAIGMMFLFLWMVIEATWKMVAYCCMKAFLTAEFMASLEWQLEYFAYRGRTEKGVLSILTLAIVYGAVTMILWIIESRMKRDEIELEISVKELYSTLLIVLSAFMLSNLSFVYRNTPFSGSIATDIFTIRTLVDFGGLAILYAYQSLRHEVGAEKELSKIQSILTAQYDSYRNYQEVTDLINMKYHDLKHQIAGLRAEQDSEKRSKWIDQMEDELAAYQPERQTGNQVLDGVLDGKMPLIRNAGIAFTCVADGELLKFIHVTDICTIFGNALDNAIEYVSMISDPEKKIIHMEISSRKQFVYAEVRNYCDTEIKIKNGFPMTTKRDAGNHGFGIKSISYAAKKYGGTMQFGVKDHFFFIRILIPKEEIESSL